MSCFDGGTNPCIYWFKDLDLVKAVAKAHVVKALWQSFVHVERFVKPRAIRSPQLRGQLLLRGELEAKLCRPLAIGQEVPVGEATSSPEAAG